MIDVYRTTFEAPTDEADKDDDFLGIEGRNLLDFIKSRDGLSNKEKNMILQYHNGMIDDKSQGGKAMMTLLYQFVNDNKIT